MKKSFLLLIFSFVVLYVSAQTRDLNYFISEGLKNSPLLKEYQNQIARNRLDSMRVAAGLGFQVTAISNNSYAPVIKGWGYDQAITNGANVSALLSVSKELTGLNNRKNRYESIDLQNKTAVNAAGISEQELKKSIVSQYITAYSDEQQLNFNTTMLELLNKEELILRKLTESSIYRQTDYLTFCVSQRQQKILVENLKNQYLYDYLTLCYLCGIVDSSAPTLADPDLKVAERMPDISTSIFYQQFTIDSLKLQNTSKQIDFSYKPKITVFADGGYNSSFTYMPGRNFGTSAGITLSIPIYDGGQKKLQQSQLTIDEQNRTNYRNFFISQYQQQINKLTQQLRATELLTAQITEQIKYTQTLVEADQKLLEKGDIRIAEYIIAIGNYLSAKNMLSENTLAKYQIINELNYWNRTK